jgi:hypothetical protein
MRTYTVHHRLSGAVELKRHVENIVFVKDGFCWPGLFFPAFWLLFRGMWLVLLAYVAVTGIIVLGADAVGLSEGATAVLGAGVNVLMGFEGNDLRRWTLHRRGLRMVGIVTGRRLADAERRFLESLADGSYRQPQPVTPAPRPRPSAAPRGTWANPDTEDDVVGLFPKPETGR